jgi:hypothetical protein
MSNIVAKIKANKNVIVRKTLIIGGTVAGLAVGGLVLLKIRPRSDEELFEDSVSDETPTEN